MSWFLGDCRIIAVMDRYRGAEFSVRLVEISCERNLRLEVEIDSSDGDTQQQ